jgi:hypothetical protein
MPKFRKCTGSHIISTWDSLGVQPAHNSQSVLIKSIANAGSGFTRMHARSCIYGVRYENLEKICETYDISPSVFSCHDSTLCLYLYVAVVFSCLFSLCISTLSHDILM